MKFIDWSDFEIDFFAESIYEKAFFQVSYTVKEEKTYNREIKPFFEIKEQYPKNLLTLDNINNDDRWIIVKNIIDWCLES